MEKPIDNRTNLLRINSLRMAISFISIAKKILGKFETLEMHALGNAICLAVKVVENLLRYGYATTVSIDVHTEEVRRDNVMIKKPKMIVIMKKTPDFFKKIEEYEKLRATELMNDMSNPYCEYTEVHKEVKL